MSGDVLQETVFNNLSYSYNISNYPLYFTAKPIIDTSNPDVKITMNVGIGPNFMQTNHFTEKSQPGGDAVSIPDQFWGNSVTTAFSAMAGAGIQLDHVFGKAPLECGYKFFFLGQGHFNTMNDQVRNSFKTGNVYTNALSC